MRYPIWWHNFRSLLSYKRLPKNRFTVNGIRYQDQPVSASEELGCLLLLAGSVHRWLDATHVCGNPSAERLARWTLAYFRRFAHFDLLTGEHPCKSAYLRLQGLVG